MQRHNCKLTFTDTDILLEMSIVLLLIQVHCIFCTHVCINITCYVKTFDAKWKVLVSVLGKVNWSWSRKSLGFEKKIKSWSRVNSLVYITAPIHNKYIMDNVYTDSVLHLVRFCCQSQLNIWWQWQSTEHFKDIIHWQEITYKLQPLIESSSAKIKYNVITSKNTHDTIPLITNNQFNLHTTVRVRTPSLTFNSKHYQP